MNSTNPEQGSDTPPAPQPQPAGFRPTGAADKELEWFFAMAESDMGLRSNFMVMVGSAEPDDAAEDRAEASGARRQILQWLWEVGDRSAGILQVAYATRRWPALLRSELGRATGIAVRLASAEVGLCDDDDELEVLEISTAERLAETLRRLGRRGLERYDAKAQVLLKQAFAGYVRERGGPERPVLRGVS